MDNCRQPRRSLWQDIAPAAKAAEQKAGMPSALREAQAALGELPGKSRSPADRGDQPASSRRIEEALATLDRLERLQPRFSRLHEERGLCYVALKDAPRAINALLCAPSTSIRRCLHSWRMLEGLYRLTGDLTESAAMAADHVATLKHLPPEVVAATSLFSDGDLDRAETHHRAHFSCSTATIPKPCGCWPGSGWPATSWTMLSCCSRRCWCWRRTISAARLRLCPGADVAAQISRRRADEIEQLLKLDPGSIDYRTLGGHDRRRPWRARKGDSDLPELLARNAARSPMCISGLATR